jgi:hypothetical protein
MNGKSGELEEEKKEGNDARNYQSSASTSRSDPTTRGERTNVEVEEGEKNVGEVRLLSTQVASRLHV